MKLKTSFFNPTVLKKDITRFAPLWGLYTVFMLMTVFLLWADDTDAAQFAANAPSITQSMGAVNLIYAGFCSILLFGDLFTSKMAGMLHAMPLRREGWFLTHFTAGMLFCIVPNALGAVIASMALQQYCYLAFIWLAVMILQFFVFFAIGAFAAQCAGNKLGAVAIYGLVNFLSVLVGFLVATFYEPQLQGVVFNMEKLYRGSPVVDFCCSGYMAVQYDYTNGLARFEGLVAQNWQYLLIAFGVGLVLLAVSVVLYRRRQLESAGDFIAFRPAAPVFLILYALSAGAFLYLLADAFGTDAEYLFLVIGFGIGIFTGHMLLEKKVNVFQWKKWANFGILTVVFFLILSVVALDPLGLTRSVPDREDVEAVRLSANYSIDGNALQLTDPEDIETAIRIHKIALDEQQHFDYDEGMTLRLRYYLTDGNTTERKYVVSVDSESARLLRSFYTDFSQVAKFDTVDGFMQGLDSMDFIEYGEGIPNIKFREEGMLSDFGTDWVVVEAGASLKTSNLIRGLMEAVEADCQAGNMAQVWDFHRKETTVGCLSIGYKADGRYQYLDILVYESCENTINYLKSLVSDTQNSTPVASLDDVIAGNVPETATVPTTGQAS